MKIKEITPPRFWISKIYDKNGKILSEPLKWINEYELRQLQIDVKNSKDKITVSCEDLSDVKFTILEDGRLDSNPEGLNLCFELMKELNSHYF